MKASRLQIDYFDTKSSQEFHLPISIFKKPANENDYALIEKCLDNLIDVVRGNEKHPLAEVMQILGDNLEQYDNENSTPIGNDVSDIEFVKYLMTSHGMKQIDLADIFGGQANVSRFLNGERSLSKNQIIGLKRKFKISADFFLKELKTDKLNPPRLSHRT